MAFFRPPNGRSDSQKSLKRDLDVESGSLVGAALDSVGFGDWYRTATARGRTNDPWAEFCAARESVRHVGGRLRVLLDLFLLDRSVPERSLSGSLGETAARWLQLNGVVRNVGCGRIQANFCLLSCFDCYLFIDWPISTPLGRLLSVDTYLSGSSYDCAFAVSKHYRGGPALELGCGSGLIALLLAQRSPVTTVVDIDPRAIKLTKLNLTINGRVASIVQSDLTTALSGSSRFDFVIVNPPWRIVPPGIAYPNPTARVGTGPDGLDYVRRVLGILPKLLAEKGKAVMRFDVPVHGVRTGVLFPEVESLRGAGLSVNFEVLDEISIARQAEISADTCSHLNEEISNLPQRFVDHYLSLGVLTLSRVFCTVHNNHAKSTTFNETTNTGIQALIPGGH